MENTDFGWLLQKYRRRARDPLRSGKLTQERLAELFAEEVGINYSRGAISDWERGKSQINKDDRTVLVGLVTVLYRCRGITRLDQANDWLATGNYRPLDKAEREGVAAEWAIEGDREQKDQLFEGSKSDPVMVTARITGPGQTTTTRTFDPLPHRMPVPATPFVGRQDELVAMDILLADPAVRLVTIVGAGGMGKTRLAMEVAERQVAGSAGNGRRFSNGIYFVPLAPVDHDDGVVPTVAEALNFPIQTEATEMREPGQQLCDYLRHKNILFVMDNVEHLPAAGELVAHILRCAPRVQILATSREPLYLTDEQIYPIRGLTFSSGEISTTEADVDLPAIALFLQSAHRVRPDFSPSGEGMVTLAHICHLLDGMPLGIELAASWVGVLSLDDVAAEIEGSLDFLVTRLRDIPDRHRSLRAVIDSSWDRLSKKEKAVFSQASVFRGGFTRRAASQITDAALPLLASLADKSMLYFIRDRQRYEVHETLRQFGAGKLAEDKDLEKATRDNHSAYYLETLQSRLLDLKGERQRETLENIESDIENARNAWNWAVAQEHTEQVDRAIDSLNLFYERRGRYREGESACRMAVEQFSKEPKTGENNPERERVLVKVLAWQIRFSYLLGWGEQVDRLLPEVEKILESENLAPADTRSERAFILQLRGQRAGDADLNEGQKLHREALGLYQELGAEWGQAYNVLSLGRWAWQVGE